MGGWFVKSSRKKKLAVILAAVAAVILLGSKVFSNKKSGYVLAKVQKQMITEVVTESGVITTNGRVSVYSPTTWW
jgi:hypothetical protein